VEGALMLLPSLYKMKKSWEELEQLIIKRFGVNYSNYPASVEYFIKIMKYIEKQRESKALVKNNPE
tara:strand:+ start:610 stop:807 length:198 start_codon:yes stop_codon:yes gene_type:complete